MIFDFNSNIKSMRLNSLSYFLLVAALQLLFGCSVDDYQKLKHESENAIRLEYKTFYELMKEKKFNNAYSKVAVKQQKAMRNKTVMEDQYDFTISNKPVTVITTDARLSYNILIERDSIHEDYFENLVVQVDTLNQT